MSLQNTRTMNSVSRVLFLSYTFTFVSTTFSQLHQLPSKNNNRKFCREWDLNAQSGWKKRQKRERERGRTLSKERRHFESSNYRSLGIHNNGPSSGVKPALPCMWMTQMHVTGRHLQSCETEQEEERGHSSHVFTSSADGILTFPTRAVRKGTIYAATQPS